MSALIAWLVMLVAAAPAGPAGGPYTLRQYMAITRSNEPHFSPTADRIAFAANATGSWQVWITPVARWRPRQLSHFEGNSTCSWSPTGDTLLAMTDRNGDQKYQLLTLDVRTGAVTQLTHDPEVRNRIGGWMPGGRSIFYTSNARDRRYF